MPAGRGHPSSSGKGRKTVRYWTGTRTTEPGINAAPGPGRPATVLIAAACVAGMQKIYSTDEQALLVSAQAASTVAMPPASAV